jgi:hypothetical protein
VKPGTRVRYVWAAPASTRGYFASDVRGTVRPMPVNRSPNKGRAYIFVEWDHHAGDPRALISPYPPEMIEALSLVDLLAEIEL